MNAPGIHAGVPAAHGRTLVVATGNAGKLHEITAVLGDLGITVVPFVPEDLAETGMSFVENALIKARHAALQTGGPALGDDSGLEVDALQGAPGIYSARYAGEGASDGDNVAYLLTEMADVPEERRTARFHCVLAYLRHPQDPVPLIAHGVWEGRVLRAPCGNNGFGYDPVFYVSSHRRSSAELPPAVKNRLSHRGQALRQMHRMLGAFQKTDNDGNAHPSPPSVPSPSGRALEPAPAKAGGEGIKKALFVRGMTGLNVVSGAAPSPSTPGPPPLSLYIHIPWCVRKCPYCDFNSHEFQGVLPEADYVSAVLRDLDHEAHRIAGREVQTIFIGGGTPSLLSGEAVGCLLSGVRARVEVAAPAEVTLESNPGSVDGGRLVDYQEAGVNRLSIGVQSFRARQLAALGRIHGADDALRAFETARRAGVSNINLDLMFGLPEDDRDGSLQDLSQAIALGPEHLSWYQLAIEPNTAFYRHPPELPDDDEVFAAYEAGRALLRDRGYLQYEVSVYAREGAECRHNRNYWEFGDYLGIGAGAHGKLSDLASRRIVRSAKRAKPRSYIHDAGSPAAIVEESPLTDAQLTVEFMMNALRLAAGFPLSLFTARTGLPVAAIEGTLKEARERGLIEVRAGWLRPTEWGYRYLNELVYLFYRDEPDAPRGAVA